MSKVNEDKQYVFIKLQIMISAHCFLKISVHGGIQRGEWGQGVRTPVKNHMNLGFLAILIYSVKK